MPPEIAEVRRWLQKAVHDRSIAEAAITCDPPITIRRSSIIVMR